MQPRQKLMVRLYILLSIVKTEFTKPDYALQVITVDSRGKKKGLIMKIAIYSFLLAVLMLVIPASQNSPLPETYFELVAANRAPISYRLTIALDVTAWLALGG